jgi:spore coat polysaccharide biosynthesis protein SpsF
MRVVTTIEARMGSSRLPGKVLAPILGRPMLAWMIDRLRRVRWSDEIVVATTTHPADDPIVELARGAGVAWHRGSEADVLSRVLGAARAARADLIVETTGDCPLIDPAVVDQAIQTFRTNAVDYCGNVLARTYPRGLDVQVFPTSVLAEVAELTTDPADREHVSLYIYSHPERFRLLNLASGLPDPVAALRLTVDTADDLQLVRRIFAALGPWRPRFGLTDIVELFEHEPDLFELNRHVAQKAVRQEAG